jgi:hypothetical protein
LSIFLPAEFIRPTKEPGRYAETVSVLAAPTITRAAAPIAPSRLVPRHLPDGEARGCARFLIVIQLAVALIAAEAGLRLYWSFALPSCLAAILREQHFYCTIGLCRVNLSGFISR